MYDLRNIYGNTGMIKNLSEQISEGRMAHAYIISGEPGSGKKTTANALAKALLCEKGGGYSCNACVSCITYESSNNPDILRIHSGSAKTVGVDVIREKINETAQFPPYLYEKKIYLIENAEAMTVQAQNALLKTLENAPKHCVFILIAANPALLLPTILSRCVLLTMKQLPHAEVEKWLKKELELDDDKARFFSALSNGSIGRAKDAAQSENYIQFRKLAADMLGKIRDRDISEIFALSKLLEASKENIAALLDIFLMWYRDMLSYVQFGSEEYILQKDFASIIIASAPQSSEEITQAIELIIETKTILGKNANYQLACDVMLLTLAGKIK